MERMTPEEAFTTHECNAFCRPDEGMHCELVLSENMPRAYLEPKIKAAYWHHYGFKVERIKPAYEAPGLERIPQDKQYQIGAKMPPSDATRWLVYWRK